MNRPRGGSRTGTLAQLHHPACGVGERAWRADQGTRSGMSAPCLRAPHRLAVMVTSGSSGEWPVPDNQVRRDPARDRGQRRLQQTGCGCLYAAPPQPAVSGEGETMGARPARIPASHARRGWLRSAARIIALSIAIGLLPGCGATASPSAVPASTRAHVHRRHPRQPRPTHPPRFATHRTRRSPEQHRRWPTTNSTSRT